MTITVTPKAVSTTDFVEQMGEITSDSKLAQGPSEQRMMDFAASIANNPNLSAEEKAALLKLAKQMAKDGDINPSDAKKFESAARAYLQSAGPRPAPTPRPLPNPTEPFPPITIDPIEITPPKSGNDEWSATTPQNGQATIQLGDDYELLLNEGSSEMQIRNKETGEVTKIWGDPHLDFNGQRVGDFWGTTTFTLENGTKITIETTPYANDPNQTLSSKVTITQGSKAIVVRGLDQNTIGDLNISQSNNGYAVDARTDDGFVLNENQNGGGWLDSTDGKLVTQQDFNEAKNGGKKSDPNGGYDFGDSNPMDVYLGVLGAMQFVNMMRVAWAVGSDGHVSRNESRAVREVMKDGVISNREASMIERMERDGKIGFFELLTLKFATRG